MDRGQLAMIIIWILLVISGIFLGLRIYCRSRGGGKLWWDDWVIILAFVFSCVDHGVGTAMISLGVGKHIAEVDPANLPMLHVLNRVGSTFAIVGCALTKTSWALTMIRIVRATRDCMRVLVWCLLVSVNVLMDVGVILNFLQCDDTGLTGNPSEMWCWTNVIAAEYNIFSAAWSGLSDIILALLAWVIIWPMQMRTRDKVGVAVAMSLGIVSGIMGFAKTANILLMSKMDFTYEVPNLIIWTAAEISSLIVAASVPFIRHFVKNKLSSPKSHSSGTQGTDGQPQEKSFTSSVPTTVGSSRPGLRTLSGDSHLLADSPPQTAGDGGTVAPSP